MKFIDPQLLPLMVIDKSYNPYLVVLSIVIAVISSFSAFGTSERISTCSHRVEKMLWVFFGAVSLGIGIWAMHFIASLALQLPIPVSYNLNLTLVSVIPAVMASSVVFWLMNQADFSLKRLLFCGLLMGTGIGVMHYIGMAAMELNAKMVYLKSMFIFSILVVVILAILALKLKFSAINKNNYQFINKEQCLSALVMGSAVSGMHYSAMAAVVFIPVDNAANLVVGINASILSLVISVVVLLVLTVVLIVPHILRFRQMVQVLRNNEVNLKIAAIAFQTHEAILLTNVDGEIVKVNKAFTRVTGYDEDEVVGKTPKILKSGRHNAAFYKNFWNTIIKDGKWSGEVWNKRKNGEIFPEWQTISAVKNKHGETTHYISFFSDILEFKIAEKKIEKLAFYDSLTGLPNRRLLYERLEYELDIAKRYQRKGMLFFLDLDRFKQINDSLGHSVGDLLLIEVARRLQSLLRKSDTAVRLGGDEFIVLVSPQNDNHRSLVEQSSVIAEKIIKAINHSYLIGGQELFISTSIGITLYTGVDETVEILLQRADTAMYQAKDAGKNTYRFYQQSMQDAIDVRLQIERNLHVAITKNELSLHYQPQLSDANKIIGVEALIRWRRAVQGNIPPNDFIPIAEDSGLIISVGQWIIETACKQLNTWDAQNIHIPHIAINISARQFHQADFVPSLIQTLLKYQVSSDRVMLEITESAFLGNIEEAINKMNELKQSGFSFSIDDFGTGFSSLTYLKRLPFDQLKIDQSFVRGLVNSSTDAAIVKAIIAMAKSMDLNLIAEGVETEQQLASLSDFGCHNYQGYFFSKPLPAIVLKEYIESHVEKSEI